MDRLNWWVETGMAAAAARELTWFVILVFLGIGVALWMDNKKD